MLFHVSRIFGKNIIPLSIGSKIGAGKAYIARGKKNGRLLLSVCKNAAQIIFGAYAVLAVFRIAGKVA